MLMGLIVVFGLAALVGMYLLAHVLIDKNTPKGGAILHGGFAILGIILLSLTTYSYPSLIYSFILFILAALGGIIIFSLDILGKKIPKFLALGHGLLAVSGFIVLIWGIIHL
ncbi:MAG: hypothetical protein EPN84_03375 [Legionella sp.]|nr:MAG: hypothetical protein EPN84_03375 [Legionella sp.]